MAADQDEQDALAEEWEAALAAEEGDKAAGDGGAGAGDDQEDLAAEWEAALAQAQPLAELLLARPPAVPLVLLLAPSRDAAFAMVMAPETPAMLRCYYAGPVDADAASLIDMMATMDRGRGGNAEFSPFLRAVTINQNGTSTRMVIFGGNAAELVGRAPHVGMGVSYYRPLGQG